MTGTDERHVVTVEPGPSPDEGRPYPDPTHSLAPRKPRTLGGIFFLGVVGTVAAGLTLVALEYWRTGLVVMGAGMLAGALARLVMPDDRAGMLGIRRKFVDVVTLMMLGGGLLLVATLIRTRPS